MGDKRMAVIWDMDGVIADTAPYHLNAWQYVFAKRGVDFTEVDFRRNFGQRNDTIIKIVLGEDITLDEIGLIADEKEKRFRKQASEFLTPLPGALDLIKSLGEYGFLQALGSSAPPENVDLVTGKLGIGREFQAIVTGRDVEEGKPSPLGFLLAARKLGVEPRKCVVIEDALAGVSAARKAGMRCLAVTSTNQRERLGEADLVFDSLAEVNPKHLESLLEQNGCP